MNLEAVYLQMPTLAQNFVCNIMGWRIQRSRFGPNFLEQLRQVKKRAQWSTDRVLEFRDQRLRSFLVHCAETVPYYRRLFAEADFQPERVRTLSDLAGLPVLTKAIVQGQDTELLSESIRPRERVPMHTSGTTGGGLRFAVTTAAVHEQWAVWSRYRQWHGLGQNTWQGYFAGRSVVPLAQKRPPYWRYNFPGRQILFSGYHMGPATLETYVSLLRQRQPPWLHGYPSLLALLAGYLDERRESLGYDLRWITTGAENLLPRQIDVIERTLGVRPIQHYGMAEAVANFSQCPRGKLHVDEDFAAVEFLPLPQGGYRVVGTNFSNLATPLVRYEVGDVVDWDPGDTCDCGLPGRIVRRVDGRQEDYVILRNGARLGRMDHVFKDMTAIREAQIVQEEPGQITVRVVKNPRYGSSDETLLLEEFQKRVGDQATIRVEYTERIPRTESGKLRFVISKVGKGQLVSAAPDAAGGPK